MTLVKLALDARRGYDENAPNDAPVAPQLAFLEELARIVSHAPGFKAPEMLAPTTIVVRLLRGATASLAEAPQIEILGDGSIRSEPELEDILRDGSRVNLHVLAARIAPIWRENVEVQRACAIAQGMNLWGGRATGEYEKYCHCGQLVRTEVRPGVTRTSVLRADGHEVAFDVTQQFPAR